MAKRKSKSGNRKKKAAAAKATQTHITNLPVERIAYGGAGEHRRGNGDLEALAKSLEAVGLLEPIGVVPETFSSVRAAATSRETRYRVLYGRRRLAAARLLKWKTVAAVVHEINSPRERERLAALENLDRRDLNPVEEALTVCRQIEVVMGRKAGTLVGSAGDAVGIPAAAIEETAALFGRSVDWVRTRAILLRLAPPVRDLVAARRLPLGHAREIAKLADPETQSGVAEMAAADEDGGRADGLDQVKRHVEWHLQALRGIRWDPSVPFAGRPACATCPSNTANAEALFAGSGAADLAEARCLDKGCYEAKAAAAEKAFAQAVRSAETKQLASTAASIRPVLAEGLKAGPVVRELKKRRGEGPKPKTKPDGTRDTTARPGPPRPMTAEEKFEEAVDQWCEDNRLGRAIAEYMNGDPEVAVMLLVLSETGIVGWNPDSSSIDAVASILRGEGTSLDKAFLLARQVAARMSRWQTSGVHGWALTSVPETLTEPGAGILALVLEALPGLDVPPLPKREDFEDSAPPETEKPTQEETNGKKPKKTAKKKATKKKTAKKKTAKRAGA